ncbi:MAG: hypothetical protein RRB13_00465 [bacterium]|nr:hypothetical protein [bacterium]
MKGISLFAAILLASSPALMAESACSGAGCLPQPIQDSCTVNTVSGCIDWEKGIVYSTGMGVPNEKFTSAAQKRYSAYQAARVVAQRNLLAMIEDINITSEQTVKMGMLENDTINVQIQGTIKHVSEVGKPKVASDGSTYVTMQMHLRDILSILQKNEGFELMDQEIPSSPDLRGKGQTLEGTGEVSYGGNSSTVYTGLIIDARGTGVKPAMSPKVVSQEGREIYGSAKVDREFALEYGVVGYVKSLEQAQNSERVQGNPLYIKASLLGTKKQSDLKISEEDAHLLMELELSQAFLREGRVMIVL